MISMMHDVYELYVMWFAAIGTGNDLILHFDHHIFSYLRTFIHMDCSLKVQPGNRVPSVLRVDYKNRYDAGSKIMFIIAFIYTHVSKLEAFAYNG